MSRPIKRPTEVATFIEEKISKCPGVISSRRYLKGKFLGKGGFARCFEVTAVEAKQTYAAKVVPKASLAKPRAKQKLMTEIKIHRSLHNPYIVGFEHFFEDTENVYILLELCKNQSLNELLKRRKRLTEFEVQCYARQILEALKYLRERRVIHRDLKLGNLFLTEKMELKLGDFGLAAKLEFDGQRRHSVCGTPNYIAPEILDSKQGHSYEVDLWSFGVIVYTLLVGRPPFETPDIKTTYRRIRMNAYTFPDHVEVSEPARSLIGLLLVGDPNKRLTLENIEAHRFFNPSHTVPRLMPSSTTACPPSTAYLRKYMPLASMNNRPTRTQSASVIKTEPRPLLTRKESARETVKTETGKESPEKLVFEVSPGPDVWVKKWVDYSSKYGIGYALSNGTTGVYYNDFSTILVNPATGKFEYIAKDEKNYYSLTEFPEHLQKKVTLLAHFRSHLEKDTEVARTEAVTEVYVQEWTRTRHAIMFKLSNHVTQVNFQDRTELVLSSGGKVATYVSKAGDRQTCTVEEVADSKNSEMVKRLKYTQDLLARIVTDED